MFVDYNNLIILPVALPFLLAALIFLVGGKVRPNFREFVIVLTAAVTCVIVFGIAFAFSKGGEGAGFLGSLISGSFAEGLGAGGADGAFSVAGSGLGEGFAGKKVEIFEIVEGLCLSLKADGAGVIFACVSSCLWVAVSIYSIGYLRGHGEEHQNGFYGAFATCIGATMGICFSSNLFSFFMFYEVLTVATYPLVVHGRDLKGKASGRKYLVYTLVSGQLLFAAMIVVFINCGTLEFVPGGFVTGEDFDGALAFVVYFMLIAGGLVKAGVMPLHSWLPAAMVAPTPVSALLHAVAVVKAGAFCVLRVSLFVFTPELLRACNGAVTLATLAGVTIIFASMVAITKDNLKARLAYSTVSQLSYIVLGIALLTPVSVTGAVYHIIAHAFLKITLFMCAGAIFVKLHVSEISQMRGVGRRMPFTMAAFTLASLGIAGLPFMAGFVSKMNIMAGALEAGAMVYVVVLVASALLALTYLVPVGYVAFDFGRVDECEKTHYSGDHAAGGKFFEFEDWNSRFLVIPIIFTITVAILLGVDPNLGPNLLDMAVKVGQQLLGGN